MSRPSHRFNKIHQAVIATTISLSTLATHAANLSQANIQSAQHEPLSATIDVSNIDAKNFSANLANDGIYQQMGLAQNPTISVHFTPTSDTTGKITLSSTAPISTPFADIVLSLNDNGNQSIEPQTLLMPMSSNSNIPASLITPIMIAADHEQDLPVAGGVVDGGMIDLASGEPLEAIPEGMDIFDNTYTNTTDYHNPVTIGVPTTPNVNTDTLSTNNHINHNHSLANIAPETQTTTNNTQTPLGQTISEESRVISAITPEGTNTQLNILTEQITRRILPEGASIVPQHTEQPIQEPAISTEKTPKIPNAQSSEEAIYVVQSGDNLWSIASEIAKANDVSVTDVMKEIHQQNPDAFFNNNISQLKTQATLRLPNYNVVPSQRAIQEAINVQKQTRTSHGTNQRVSRGHEQNHGSSTARSQRQSTTRSNNKTQTRAQNKPLPKAQLTLVSPSNGGQATGTHSKGGNNGTGTANNNTLVNTLRNKRNQTVANANRVNSLNQEFSAAKQRLKLQNDKLAELDKRLKALKENK